MTAETSHNEDPRSSNSTEIVDPWSEWHESWQAQFQDFASEQMRKADAGHDFAHALRVVRSAELIGIVEDASPTIVLPAAWLHDCVVIAKNAPERSSASKLSADRAVEFLENVGYPMQHADAIHHAIVAHSFSAGVTPQTLEAKVVQDADRLEALGALGLARCLMTGGTLGQHFMHPDEPFPHKREADDREFSLDHLFVKLLRLPATMQTQYGYTIARMRARFLVDFLKQLAGEIGIADEDLEAALAQLPGHATSSATT